MHALREAGDWGLSDDPARIYNGRNSGFQAANIAALTGPATIILLAYDARAPRTGERTHWFGEHPRSTPHSVFRKYVEAFEQAAGAFRTRGIRIINATPGSAIEIFEKMPLEDALSLA